MSRIQRLLRPASVLSMMMMMMMMLFLNMEVLTLLKTNLFPVPGTDNRERNCAENYNK